MLHSGVSDLGLHSLLRRDQMAELLAFPTSDREVMATEFIS